MLGDTMSLDLVRWLERLPRSPSSLGLGTFCVQRVLVFIAAGGKRKYHVLFHGRRVSLLGRRCF